MTRYEKFVGIALQTIAMIGDILIILALFIVGKYEPFVAVLLFLAVTYSLKNIGGWFFAWKKNNIKNFFNNWKQLCQQDSKY